MRLRLAGLGLAAVVFAGTAGCDESLSSLTGPTPDLEPTFSSIQSQIFDSSDPSGRLACVSCHNARGRAFTAGLDLTAGVSYASLVGVASTERPSVLRVAPGDPNSSYMVHKLEGGPNIVGERMPRGTGPYLTEGQMVVIRRWIETGAPNN
jgi:hypothetical protein